MGLLYSLTSMFYGQSTNDSKKLDKLKIQISVNRLLKGLRIKQQKIAKLNQKRELNYIQSINKDPKQRLLQLQRTQLNNLVQEFHKFVVYQQLYNYCQRIKSQAQLIANRPTQISNQCYEAICAIIQLYKDYQLDSIIDLTQFLNPPYPTQKLSKEIKPYLLENQIMFYDVNVYILQMIARHHGKINLQKINQIGHAFQKNPQKVHTHTSTQMYACTFDNEEIHEQQNIDNFLYNLKNEKKQQNQSNFIKKQQQKTYSNNQQHYDQIQYS